MRPAAVRIRSSDNEASASVHFRIGHLRLSFSSHELDVGAGGTVTVTTELPVNATETVFIKDKAGATRRTLVNSLPRTSGVYNDVWDGKDNAGTNLVHGEYFVLATVVTQDPVTYTLDLTNTGGVRRPDTDPVTSEFHLSYPEVFSPYEGEFAEFTFDLDEPSEVDLKVYQNNPNEPERRLLVKEPLPMGSRSLVWDGTDDNGALMSKALSGLENWTIFYVYSLSDNCILVYGERPEVTALEVDPVYFSPVDKDYPSGLELAYSISKTSNVVISIQNSQGNVVKTMSLGSQSPGSHSVYWDGRTNGGELTDSGRCRIGIQLTDSLGNTSLVRYALFVLYY